jgi:amino acid adenylation domain-containing protein
MCVTRKRAIQRGATLNLSEVETPRQSSAGRRLHPTNPFEEFNKADIDQSIADRFERQAGKFPGRIAIKTHGKTLTYDELNRKSNRLAHAILARCGKANEPIALLFKQGASMITAMLGGLKAGKICVPMDYSLPPARARQILQHIEAALVLTDSDNFSVARQWGSDPSKVLKIEDLPGAVSDENPRLFISPDEPAYINYTSGSTGEPKGVVWSHRHELHNTMLRINALHICPEDRITLLRSNNVGATRDTFLALLSGATLLPLELKEEGLTTLGNWLITEEITIFSCVATVFRHTVKSLTGRETFPKIRLVNVGGEPLSKFDVELYKKYFSDNCLFVSRFGISETPTISYYFINKHSEINEERVPVGYPLDGNEVQLLDDEGKAVGVNSVGEIVVKSAYLAAGYWRQLELTREKFRADPAGGDVRVYRTGDLGYRRPDGCLVHAGRKDFQTKIRGHRVEVSEVEMALLRVEGIKQAAVVARDDDGDGRQLVAYVVPQERQALTVGALRASLKEKLPSYMQPSAFVILDRLPLTASGKVDRRALPPPARSRQQLDSVYATAKNSVDQVLANLWADVLGVADVGIDDDFLQLGGDSLLGARIVARVNENFSLTSPLKVLFDTPTVARLSAYLTEHESSFGQAEKTAEALLKVAGTSVEEMRNALEQERGKRDGVR